MKEDLVKREAMTYTPKQSGWYSIGGNSKYIYRLKVGEPISCVITDECLLEPTVYLERMYVEKPKQVGFHISRVAVDSTEGVSG